jgi:hypothetical protein
MSSGTKTDDAGVRKQNSDTMTARKFVDDDQREQKTLRITGRK